MLLSIPDRSGVWQFLSDLEPGFPVPAVMFEAPFEWAAPGVEGLFARAGFSAGTPRSFHCRSTGITAGRTFHSAGWFSGDGWAYLLESVDAFRIVLASDTTCESAMLYLADDRLSLGIRSDSSGNSPAVLWESPTLTGAAGAEGAGIGFATALAPGLMIGPAFTADGPWLKSSLEIGQLAIHTGPAFNRSGLVKGMAGIQYGGERWLLGVHYDGDSTSFGGTVEPLRELLIGVTGPEWGASLAIDIGNTGFSASAGEGGAWCAGSELSFGSGSISAWGLFEEEWKLGVGLEIGRGADRRSAHARRR